MTTTDPALICRRNGAVAEIIFNRPHALNAIDEASACGFRDACDALSRDPEVRAVVLKGSGRAFVAGGDLAFLDREPGNVAERLIEPFHAGIERLCALACPVVASVHGVVAGAGLGLVLASDLAIASEGTRFNMAYLRIGASCDGGNSWFLPRTLGLKRAMEFALLDPVIDAGEALRIGLVNKVVPETEREAQTRVMLERVCAAPPLAVTHMKRLLLASFGNGLRQQLDAERDAFGACAGTAEFKQLVKEFFDARASRN